MILNVKCLTMFFCFVFPQQQQCNDPSWSVLAGTLTVDYSTVISEWVMKRCDPGTPGRDWLTGWEGVEPERPAACLVLRLHHDHDVEAVTWKVLPLESNGSKAMRDTTASLWSRRAVNLVFYKHHTELTEWRERQATGWCYRTEPVVSRCVASVRENRETTDALSWEK